MEYRNTKPERILKHKLYQVITWINCKANVIAGRLSSRKIRW